LAYDSEIQDKSTPLYPMAPAFKELSEYLIKDQLKQGNSVDFLGNSKD